MKLKCSLFFLVLAGLSYNVSCMLVPDVEDIAWGEWGECSRPCGGGTQSRRVVCEEGLEPQNCLHLKSTIARKQLKEERPCNTQACTGTWGNWGDWQPCSSTCGSSSSVYQMRNRTCYNGDNIIHGSWNCDGLAYEWRTCEGLPACPTNAPSNLLSTLVGYFESYSSFQSYNKPSQVEQSESESSSYFY